jgi:6-phosphogluconolactonase (cycloisomerase 2 family)
VQRSILNRPRLAGMLGVVGLAFAAAAPGAAQASGHARDTVFTETNDAGANTVLAYDRAPDGSLQPAGSYLTGGLGAGSGLGSQGAVALSDDGRLLLAVDAGSDDVAAFRVTGHGLRLAGRAPSGGDRPVSVSIRGDEAYVLNAGGVPNVSGLAIGRRGTLTQRSGAIASLPAGAAGAAQVSISPDGERLVVTEKGTNRIDAFALDRHGLPSGSAVSTPSSGATPFGFAFTRTGTLVVSEAAASTVSSYRAAAAGFFGVVTASALTHQGAACWIAVTGDGRFAYSANASTGSISGFRVARDGSLTLLDPDGRTAVAPGPNDEAIAPDGRSLYALNPGAGSITSYALQSDGHLQPQLGATGLPAGTVGLAAR